MANRYANLVGSNKIKDEWQKINEGFDKVQQEMDAKAAASDLANLQNTINNHIGSGGNAHAEATVSEAGFMSVADKQKLDGIEAGAEVNQNAFAKVNDVEAADPSDELTITGGTGITITTNPNTKEVIVTATGSSTPGPHGSAHTEFGADPIPLATTTEGGLMSASDKAKLDGATSAATPNTIVQRDPAGRFKAAAPSEPNDVARKAEVDAVQADVNSAQRAKITQDNGNAKLTISDPSKDFLAELIALGQGMHTFYVIGGAVNAPPRSTRGHAFFTTGGGNTYGYALGVDYQNTTWINYHDGPNGWKAWTPIGRLITYTSLGDIGLSSSDFSGLTDPEQFAEKIVLAMADNSMLQLGIITNNNPIPNADNFLPTTPGTTSKNGLLVVKKYNNDRNEFEYSFATSGLVGGAFNDKYHAVFANGNVSPNRRWSGWQRFVLSGTTLTWINATLQNGWETYSGSTPGYAKSESRIVYLRGRISGGSTSYGTVIFNLPAGYRPSSLRKVTTSAWNGTTVGIAALEIRPNGDVNIDYVTGNNWLSLDGIFFEAEQ